MLGRKKREGKEGGRGGRDGGKEGVSTSGLELEAVGNGALSGAEQATLRLLGALNALRIAAVHSTFTTEILGS